MTAIIKKLWNDGWFVVGPLFLCIPFGLSEIAEFAERNARSAVGSDKETWATHARKVREVVAALAALPDQQVK